MLTLLLALVLLILSGGALEYETVLKADLGGLFVGHIRGRALEVQFVRYRPKRTFVQMRAW